MNDFINKIKLYLKIDSSILNGNLENFIYTQLISHDLGKNQKALIDQSHMFEKWINRNNYSNNIRTFVSPNYPYFCQFVNPYASNIVKNAIKLYIPLDEEHLYNGVNIIIDFLTKNNIKHNSKIGKRIRNDNVVVRVSSLEEAKEVIEFLSNNKYIQEGLLNVNPFTTRINGIGLAKDGFYSYNSKFCEALTEFIYILNAENRLSDLNVSNFKLFVKEYSLKYDFDSQIIFKQILSVMNNGNLSFDDFTNIVSQKDIVDLNKEKLLSYVIKETYNKYGMNHTINALAKFRYNGDVSSFTGKKNRLMLMQNFSVDDVNSLLLNSHISSDNFLEDYIKSIIYDPFDLVVKAYTETLKKYGKTQADYAIKKYITSGSVSYITNNNMARENLKSIYYENLIDILCKGLNVSNVYHLNDLVMIFIENMEVFNRKNL